MVADMFCGDFDHSSKVNPLAAEGQPANFRLATMRTRRSIGTGKLLPLTKPEIDVQFSRVVGDLVPAIIASQEQLTIGLGHESTSFP